MEYFGNYIGFIPLHGNFIQIIEVDLNEKFAYIKTTDNEYQGQAEMTDLLQLKLFNIKNGYPFNLILAPVPAENSSRIFNGTWTKISTRNSNPTLGKVIIVERKNSQFDVAIYPVREFMKVIFQSDYYLVPFEELYNETTFRKDVNYDNTVEEKVFFLEIGDEIKLPITQYILFFKEFIAQAKGVSIEVNVQQKQLGISVYLNYSKEIEQTIVRKWLQEFINFASKVSERFYINFEHDLTEERRQYAEDSLKNQVLHLQHSLDLIRQRAKILKRENKFWRNIIKTNFNSERLIENAKMPFKSELRNLVAKNKLNLCISKLKSYLEGDQEDEYNQVLFIESKLNRLIQNKGEISEDTYEVHFARAITSLLNIIDNVES